MTLIEYYSVELEVIMHSLARLGLDVRESNGQTIFTGIASDGTVTKPFFYLGKLGSNVSDDAQWTLFFLPDKDES